jgi:hypothetical protein
MAMRSVPHSLERFPPLRLQRLALQLRPLDGLPSKIKPPAAVERSSSKKPHLPPILAMSEQLAVDAVPFLQERPERLHRTRLAGW